MHLYHGTVVHITTKNNIDKISFRCKPFIYKQFQTVSDRFISSKTSKMAKKQAFFASKKRKNTSFLHVLPQKTHKIPAFLTKKGIKKPF